MLGNLLHPLISFVIGVVDHPLHIQIGALTGWVEGLTISPGQAALHQTGAQRGARGHRHPHLPKR